MNKIILSQRLNAITDIAFKYAARILGLRWHDDHGICIYAAEPETENIILAVIGKTNKYTEVAAISNAAMARALGHVSSQNIEESELCCRGALTYTRNGITIQVSVSGLDGKNNVEISLKILSYLFNISIERIKDQILTKGGLLPA